MVKSTSENAPQNSYEIAKRSSDEEIRPKKIATKKNSGKTARARRPIAAASAPNAVFLVGFMGAGKTTVGRALAERLNWIFEDLDNRIAQAEGRTVAEIFRESGEPMFRHAERVALKRVVQELQSGSVRVIALGGGAFAQSENAALLKAARVPIIFLDAPVEELWQRCREQAIKDASERPLLGSIEQFRQLHASRRKAYLRASLRIETGNRSVEAIAGEIARLLKLRKLALRTEQGEVE